MQQALSAGNSQGTNLYGQNFFHLRLAENVA